jgi:hypothetical protein
MACSLSGRPAEFAVRGEFLHGAVDGCEVGVGSTEGPVPDEGAIAWNPEGDTNQLAVAWRDSRCADGATVGLFPDFERYHVEVISIAGACSHSDRTYEATLYLTTPVDADRVVTTLDFAGP